MVPFDKATNNIVVAYRLHYIPFYSSLHCIKFWFQLTRPQTTLLLLVGYTIYSFIQIILISYPLYVMVPADEAANNIIVVCRLHFLNTLKQKLSCTKACKETSADEKTFINSHSNGIHYKFAVNVKEHQEKLHTLY